MIFIILRTLSAKQSRADRHRLRKVNWSFCLVHDSNNIMISFSIAFHRRVELALEDGVPLNYEYRSKKEEGALTSFQVVIATSFHFTLLLWRRTWLKNSYSRDWL